MTQPNPGERPDNGPTSLGSQSPPSLGPTAPPSSVPPSSPSTTPPLSPSAPLPLAVSRSVPPSSPPAASPLGPAASPPSVHPRPHAIPPNFNAFDYPFRHRDCWLLWRYAPNLDGTWRKLHFNARGNPAVHNACAAFAHVEATFEYYRSSKLPFDGIAFALGAGITLIELRDVFLPDPDPAPITERRGVSPTCSNDQSTSQESEVHNSPCALKNEEQDREPGNAPIQTETQNTKHETSPVSPLTPSSHHPLTSSLNPSVSPSPAPPSPPSPAASSYIPGPLRPWVEEFLRGFRTYTELSPDGRGLNLISFVNRHAIGPVKSSADYPPDVVIESIAHPEGGAFAVRNCSDFAYLTGRHWPPGQSRFWEDRNARLVEIAEQLRTRTDIANILRGLPDPATIKPAPAEPAPAPSAESPSEPSAQIPKPYWLEPGFQRRSRAKPPQPESAPPPVPQPESEEVRLRNLWYEADDKCRRLQRSLRNHEAELAELYDREDERSRPPAERLIDVAHAAFRFGRTPSGEAFAVPRSGPHVARFLRRGSNAFSNLLIRRAQHKLGEVFPVSAVRTAVGWLQAEAAESPSQALPLRVAPFRDNRNRRRLGATGSASALKNEEQEQKQSSTPGSSAVSPNVSPLIASSPHPLTSSLNPSNSIVLDLGRADGKSVLIFPEGWKVTDRSPVPFRRTPVTGELPLPEAGGSLESLRSFLNVSAGAWPLIRAWLVAAMFPSIDHPVLLLRGLKGSGKRTALRILTSLIDPSLVPLRTEPKNIDRWCALAAAGWTLPVAQVSSAPDWLVDALEKSVSGDGLARRRPYSDGEFALLEGRRVVALSTTHSTLFQGDLAEPLLPIEVERIPPSRRLPASELLTAFEKQKPQLLGALLTEVATALRLWPTLRANPRHSLPDFSKIFSLYSNVAAAVPSRLSPPTNAAPATDADAKWSAADANSSKADANSTKADANSTKADANSTKADAKNATQVAKTDADANFSDADAKNDQISENGADDENTPAGPYDVYLLEHRRLAADVVEADAVGAAIVRLLDSAGRWEGSCTRLLSALGDFVESRTDLPKASCHLGRRLDRLADPLASIGIAFAYKRIGNKRNRQVTLESTNVATAPCGVP